MAIHLREPAADSAVRRLAAALGVTLTEAIRLSAENELNRVKAQGGKLSARIKKLQNRVATLPVTGKLADKGFYDDLSGDI
jgi:antitoxin VapB